MDCSKRLITKMTKEILKLYTKGYSYRLNSDVEFPRNKKCTKCGGRMKGHPIEDENGKMYCCRNCFCKSVKIRPIQAIKKIK